MQIQRFVSPLLSSNMYLLTENDSMLVIDPYICEGIGKPELALLTHEHYDHISGSEFFREKGTIVACSEECAEEIADPRRNFSARAGLLGAVAVFSNSSINVECVEPYSAKADRLLADNEILKWQGHHIKVLATPGHSKGSVCYLIDDELLFSGDTLLADSAGATAFPGGSSEALKKSLSRCSELSPSVRVYPGHGEDFLISQCGYLIGFLGSTQN